jgi:glycosyltransferase involved in cell wall biosynthesis
MQAYDNLTVSVVLGTYNGQAYLKKQLDSLLLQTRPPDEIVISDDRSTDNTVNIVNQFMEESHVPIRFVVNENNLGFSENFLRASSRASGDIIAFCDQDDIWEFDKLSKCLECFDDYTVLVVHKAQLIDRDGNPTGRFDQGIGKSTKNKPLAYDPWSVFFGFSMVFRRSLLDAADYRSRSIDYITGTDQLAHDRWVLFLANMLGSVHELDDSLVAYRQHGQNVFGASNRLSRVEKARRTAGDSIAYEKAASQLLKIADSLDEGLREHFPLFDKYEAVRFWKAAESQQKARASIYRASSRLIGLSRLIRNIATGTYRQVHTNKTRPEAILRDFAFLVLAHRKIGTIRR